MIQRQKTQPINSPLMGALNPQMQVGGYKNPSSLGPTQAGPIGATMAPNQGYSGPKPYPPVKPPDGRQPPPKPPHNVYGGPKPYPPVKPPMGRQPPPKAPYGALQAAMAGQKQPNEGLPSGWGKTMDERNMPVMGPRQAGAYNAMFVGRPAGRVGGGGGFDTGFERGSEDDWRSLYAQRDSLTPGSAEWGRLVTGANAYNPQAAGTRGYRGTQGSLPQTSGSGSAYALLNALNQRNG